VRRSSLRSDVFDFFFGALLLEKEERAGLDYFYFSLALSLREVWRCVLATTDYRKKHVIARSVATLQKARRCEESSDAAIS
jgi:hypothetical protein